MEKELQELIEWAEKQPNILALYLYGSAVDGRANALSDLDIGILVDFSIPLETLWRIEDQWSAMLPEKLDLRVVNLAPLSFQYEITTRGKRIWVSDTALVADRESLIWRKYWDEQPRLEASWKQYVQQVAEQRNDSEREQYKKALEKVRSVHQRVRESARNYTGDNSE